MSEIYENPEGIRLEVNRATSVVPDEATIMARFYYAEGLDADVIALQKSLVEKRSKEDAQRIHGVCDMASKDARTKGAKALSELTHTLVNAGCAQSQIKLSNIRTMPIRQSMEMETKVGKESHKTTLTYVVGYAYSADVRIQMNVAETAVQDEMKLVYRTLAHADDITNLEIYYSLSTALKEKTQDDLLEEAIKYANEKAGRIARAMNEAYTAKAMFYAMDVTSHTASAVYAKKAVNAFESSSSTFASASMEDETKYLDDIFDPSYVGTREVSIKFFFFFLLEE